MKKILIWIILTVLLLGGLSGCSKKDAVIEITNVSYDPTRELFEEYNQEFINYWKDEKGQDLAIIQSHGGSGKQARSVIEGNEADVVTLALARDITAIEEAGLIEGGWEEEFDYNSSPYTSTIVLLVRKANDKNIGDWGDLVREGVEIITPNPKTSGGACWNFLAAWAYAHMEYGGDEDRIKEFVTRLYSNVIVLDSGARAATTTFVENGQGDVLIAWENEAFLSVQEQPDNFEIIYPSISILTEPPVAVVDKIVKKRGSVEVARAYLEYMFSDKAQRIIGNNFYRPSNQEILKEYSHVFNLNMKLISLHEMFGGWDEAYKKFFADGAIFDQIYERK
ncbi:MAG: sulfate ABC transporter substrate-binding protein [Clostridiales bacterium]|jgi:sulfate transport system substrate-binding protein|nr:sulfate ABC transporter substrate-binding protein [Clostridiales bacterium]